jgi:hypothetical protein
LAVKNVVIITFFERIVGDTIGTISSRTRADIIGDSQLEENQFSSPVMIYEKNWLYSFLSACNSIRASTARSFDFEH